MKDKTSLKTIIISALVTGIITVLATLLLNYFSSKEKKLSYLAQTSIPFQKDSLNVRIYNLDLINEGDEVIENIKGLIQFNGQIVSDYKLEASPVLSIHDSLFKNKYEVSVASLNPSEKITLSFLISSPNQVDSLPKVDFRANGLSGKTKSVSDKKEEETPLYRILLLGMGFAVTLSSFLLTLVRKRRGSNIFGSGDDDLHSDDQNKIIAYLCGVHGLTDEISRYLDKKVDVAYWSEADYFGNISLINKGNPDNEKRLLLLLDLVEYAGISNDSRGIIYYNISKIYKSLNNEVKSEEFLNKAKQIIPKRIAKRLLIDKLFAQ
jgi:hypothetical protein